jgi:hypothetical protein
MKIPCRHKIYPKLNFKAIINGPTLAPDGEKKEKEAKG